MVDFPDLVEISQAKIFNLYNLKSFCSLIPLNLLKKATLVFEIERGA